MFAATLRTRPRLTMNICNTFKKKAKDVVSLTWNNIVELNVFNQSMSRYVFIIIIFQTLKF